MVSGMRYADRYLYFGGIGLVVIAIFAPLRNTPKVGGAQAHRGVALGHWVG